MVEQQQQRRLLALGGQFEHIVKLDIRVGATFKHNALMVGAAQLAVEDAALDVLIGHTLLLSEPQHIAQAAPFLSAGCYAQAPQRSPPGAQRLIHRIAPVEQFCDWLATPTH
jgi:hypothetical protein